VLRNRNVPYPYTEMKKNTLRATCSCGQEYAVQVGIRHNRVKLTSPNMLLNIFKSMHEKHGGVVTERTEAAP
jgi:hypothetical protein